MADGSWIRNPVVAGTFYPGNSLQLQNAVEKLLVREMEMRKPLFLLVPHAGYIYSGSTAGKAFAASELPSRIVILGPNHTGMGAPVSVWSKGSWLNPLGEVKIDEELAELLLSNSGSAKEDTLAHLREHSIEVQLPFLQVRYENIKIVPVCVAVHKYEDLIKLGDSMAKAFEDIKDDVAFVVSSDMNHYENAGACIIKDGKAIDAMVNLDPQKLYEVVIENKITMCGSASAVAALQAVKKMGAKHCEILDYSHSGMVTGDESEVVSYAGLRAW
jgi:MEMO1 family protein